MTSQVLYRKWRPQTLAEVVGQETVTRTLLNALALGRVSHAYLLCGPRGTGKTSTGRILAKAVNCLKNGKGEPCNGCPMCLAISQGRALDLIEIDAASNRGIDEIRSLREKAGFAPNEARYKVYIIDEAHMLTGDAFNAFLKTLEEPPPHVIFILATTESHKLPATIISRCQRLDFHRLSRSAIQGRLEQICQGESIQADVSVLRLIADASAGSLRDAENLLDQLIVYYGSKIELQQAQELLGQLPYRQVAQLAGSIFQGDVAGSIRLVHQWVNQGTEAKQIHRALLGYFRDLLLFKTGGGESMDLDEETAEAVASLADTTSTRQVLELIKRFGEVDFRQDAYSTLPLELALVEGMIGKESAELEPPRQAVVPSKPVARPAPEPASQRAEPATARPAPRPVAQEASRETSPPGEVEHPSTEPVLSLPKDSGQAPTEPPPAPPQQAPTQQAKRPPVPQGDVLAHLTANWRQVLDSAPSQIKRTNSIAYLRGSCRPIAVEGDVIVLEFKWDIHKDGIERPENRRTAEELLSAFLGGNYRIRCVLAAKGSGGNVPPSGTPSKGHLVKAALKMGAVPLAPDSPPDTQGDKNE